MNVDVIICTFNRAEKLKCAIQSISKADIPERISVRLIVVDNNSSDSTKKVINDFANDCRIDIKYLFESKPGKSTALNTALSRIRGDIIALTDDDVTVEKGWIRGMVDALERYPEFNCFGGKVVAVYPDKIPDWLDINSSMKFLKSAFIDLDDGNIEVEYGTGTASITPSGVNMFFRYNAIEKNGFFRTDLGPVGKELGFSEDTDYCRRLLEKGEKFMYIPSVLVYHPVYIERLNKKYLLKWQYKCGISEVRRNRGYNDAVNFLGTPRYLFMKLLQHSAGWCLSLQSRKKFYNKLRFYYTAGEIVEHLREKYL